MSWTFECSRPVVHFDHRGLSSLYLSADHQFQFSSDAQPSPADEADWSARPARVEVHHYGRGTIVDIARMSGWRLEEDVIGYIRLNEANMRGGRREISCCLELDEGRFVAFRQLCDLMLLSPQPLVLTLSCRVVGFASAGGSGLPFLRDFNSGNPMYVRGDEVQFYLCSQMEVS